MHQHRARETQTPRLTDRAELCVLDPFEIDIVRQAEDAADDLRRGETHRVRQQARHIGPPLSLEPRRSRSPLEQRRRIGVAPGFAAPELQEFSSEPRPDVFDCRIHASNARRSPGERS